MDATQGTNNVLKDENEKHGGPLHFPAEDELKQTDSMKQTVLDAKRASDSEQNMSLLQGVRLYPKAIAWSILISTCIAMEGYDVALVNNFYAFDTFNRKYGVEISPGKFEVSGHDSGIRGLPMRTRGHLADEFIRCLRDGKQPLATVPM